MTTDKERETGSQKGVAHFTGTPSPPRGTPFFRLAKGGTDAQTPDDPGEEGDGGGDARRPLVPK